MRDGGRRSSTSATSARRWSSGPGAADFVNATLSNDLAKIAPRPGAVHAVLRRRDRRHRRRPDRLLPRRRARAAGAQRRQHRRGRTPPRRGRPRRRQGRRPPRRLRRARGPGHRSPTRCSTQVGLPDRSRLHVASSRPTSASPAGHGVVVCRTGYTGERGYELVAANDGRRRALGRAAGGGRASSACCPAASARATRCAPRWATRSTARTSRLDVTPNEAAPRLGGRLEEGRVLGPRRAGRREGGRARSAGCCGLVAVGRGIPRPAHGRHPHRTTCRSARSRRARSARP